MASRDDMVSTADTTDELSPTALILKQLDAQGVPRTAANIRRAVQANAREGGTTGPDPVAGLRNAAAEDSAPSKPTARKAASKSSGGGGSSVNPPNVNLGGNPYGDEGPATDPSKPTPKVGAAAPSPSPGAPFTAGNGDTIIVDPGTGIPGTVSKAGATPGAAGDGYDPTAPIIAGIISAGKKLGDMAGFGQQNMGNMPMPPSGRMQEINPNLIGLDEVVQQPSTMEIAMQKAIAPPAPAAAPPPQITGGIAGAPSAAATDVQLPGVRPYTPDVPGMLSGMNKLPAGINPLDINTSARGPRTEMLPQNMPDNAPRVPFRGSRVGAPPGAVEGNPVGRLLRALTGGIR